MMDVYNLNKHTNRALLQSFTSIHKPEENEEGELKEIAFWQSYVGTEFP